MPKENQPAETGGYVDLDIEKRIMDREQACVESRQVVDAIFAESQAEGRDLTAEESQTIDEQQARNRAARKEIEQLRQQQEMHDAVRQRQTQPEPLNRQGSDAAAAAGTPEADDGLADAANDGGGGARAQGTSYPVKRDIRVGNIRVMSTGRQGWPSLCEFANSVKAARFGGPTDHRLLASIAQEATGSDGGFAIPPHFVDEIFKIVFGPEVGSLAQYCRVINPRGNTVTVVTDHTTPYSGGIRAYWEGESNTHRTTRPQIGELTVQLSKLTAMVRASDEVLEDSGAFSAMITQDAAAALAWELSESIINGSGLKQCHGIMHEDSLIEQAKDASQTADTITATNIANMYSRLLPEASRTAIWLISPSAFPQLQGLQVGNYPVYMPPGGMSSAPYGTIYGLPVMKHLTAQHVGDKGDIILADFSRYLLAMKGGVRSATSMHLYFDRDEQALKFQMRVGGAPLMSKAISAKHGSHTMSAFIVLAARA